MIAKLADNRDPNSLASRMRNKRNQLFYSAIQALPRPLSILDAGGSLDVWESLGLVDHPEVLITLINVENKETKYQNVISLIGDARDMHQFRDRQFDVVYSNSVIEHVGGIPDMQRMAREIRRVGERYFVQTPYLYFPIEPHFVFPFFQFLPYSLRIYLVRHFELGWIGRATEHQDAERVVRSIRLLSRRQFHSFFPEANIVSEKFFGVTKSLLAAKGLDFPANDQKRAWYSSPSRPAAIRR